MDERANRKYRRILEIVHHVAACANDELILVGGTALALVYLKNRLSVDLDFVPVQGDELRLKEMLKGCLSKHGYRTAPAAYKNQFVVHFDDTSIKLEIFHSEHTIASVHHTSFGIYKLPIASIDDIFHLKLLAYKNRKEARDMYDIVFILKNQGKNFKIISDLMREFGPPVNENELEKLVIDPKTYAFYKEVLKNVPKTGN